jgi:hypothetical protein
MSVPRARLEAFWREWLAANREAERRGDWSILADCYAENASYGWMYTPDEHFMAVGREEIRQYAVGTEMAGLEGWHYDYQATVMDESTGMIVGFWKQRSGITDDAGEEYEVLGIGGSWFGVEVDADDRAYFAWQRDWFDLGSTAHTFLTILAAGKAPPGLRERMAIDSKAQPGHYPAAELPAPLWPPPVQAGRHVTQGRAPR